MTVDRESDYPEYPLFDIQTVVTTAYDEKGFLVASCELPGGDDAGAEPFELHHPYGFASRPPDASKEDGCKIAFAYIGSAGHAMALGDTRKTKLLAELQKGESIQYGPGGNFMRCKADGSISIFTTADGKVDSKAPSVFFDVRPNAFRMSAPWGRWWFDDTGYHAFTTSGARFDMGAMSGLPAPFDQFTSYADISAASIRLKGSIVDLGADPLTKDYLAHATPVSFALQRILEILTLVINTPVVPSTSLLVTNTAIGLPYNALLAAVQAFTAELPLPPLPTSLPRMYSKTISS